MANPTGKSGPSQKPYRDALRQALADAELEGNDRRKLRRIAEKHIELASGGDLQAMKELADRLDGKAVQGIGQDSDLGPLTVRWLDAPETVVSHIVKDSIPIVKDSIPSTKYISRSPISVAVARDSIPSTKDNVVCHIVKDSIPSTKDTWVLSTSPSSLGLPKHSGPR